MIDGRRRFGTVDPFVEGGDWSFRMGRTIANRGFLRALLQNGSWDEYHLFCPDSFHRRELEREMTAWLSDPAQRARVRVRLQTELGSALREQPFDVFHSSDFTFSMPFLAGLRNRAPQPFPLTGVTHSLDGVRLASRYTELALADLAPYDTIICTSRAGRDAVAHASSFVRGRLQARFPGAQLSPPRLDVIPLGIDDDVFSLPTREAARAEFRLPADTRVILSVGRLSVRSKCDWLPLFELFARMRARGELARTLILVAGGATDAEAALLQGVIDRLGIGDLVMLFPNFPPAVKGALLAAADLYLAAVDNIQETFGLSVVEALAAGLPVIAVDYSGYRDLVSHEQTGLLVPTIDSGALPAPLLDNLGVLDSSLIRFAFSQSLAIDLDALGVALRRLLGDPALARRWGEAARARAQELRWSRVIPRYEALWSTLQQEAAQAPRPMADPQPLLWGDMPGSFAKYPSRVLADDDRVSLAPVEGVAPMRLEELGAFHLPAVERGLLDALAAGPRAVGDLTRDVASTAGVDAASVRYQLGWLLKHGLVRLG